MVGSKFMVEMVDALKLVERDDSRVLALEGEGNFGAGVDLEELYEVSKNSDAVSKFFSSLRELFINLLRFRKPVVSLVTGVAYGASLELAILSDFVISSPEAKFSSPGMRWGLFPPVLLALGPSIMGTRRLNRFILTGEEVDAREAATMGLVDLVSPDPERELERLSKELLRNGPQVLALAKRLRTRDVEERILLYMKELVVQATTDEVKEGLRAFVFRRTPPWVPR
ncbi:enoyl-CoA hydratase [Sulfodiicoccus acidiphilus]|uniref:Enoyl-CoA hydratase n=1 Tax=Sulfodiicoccus acidiphilus TaxID=1670455 RepID=A0A348B4H4_9CREN|nr:enoyl-CoA hydratase [Sulfodiicoccus acidiphilus]